MKSYHKNAFIEMRSKLEKRLNKKPNDVATLFAFSTYYASTQNSTFYNLDSAYKYAEEAYANLKIATARVQKKLSRKDITLTLLQNHKKELAQKAFDKTTKENTVNSYAAFATFYSGEPLAKKALTLRDSIAYTQAKNRNTPQAYRQFFILYPNAKEAKEAQEKYYRLSFFSTTEDQSVDSYAKFIEENPSSPLRSLAETLLFRSSIKSHNIKQYQQFIASYPQSPYVNHAKKCIWYLSETKQNLVSQFAKEPFLDTLIRERQLNEELFLPYIENGQFGFLNEECVPYEFPKYDSIPSSYSCYGVEKNFFIAYKDGKAGALSRLGRVIVPHAYDVIESFGKSTLKVIANQKVGIYHLSGFEMVSPKYQYLEPLQKHWIQFNKGKKFGVLSFYGDTLIAPLYDAIEEGPKSLVFLKIGESYLLQDLSKLSSSSEGEQSLKFSSYEITPEGNVIGETSEGFNVFSSGGELLINETFSSVSESPLGWVGNTSKGYALYSLIGHRLSPLWYQNIIVGRRGYGIKISDKWGMLDENGLLKIQPIYDTLYFLGDVGIVLEREGRKVGYFYDNEMKNYDGYQNIDIQVVQEKNEENRKIFITTEDMRGRQGLLNTDDKRILNNKYTKITVLPQNTISVALRGKKGLTNWEGKLLTPIIYDGVAKYNTVFISLLRDKKFGFFVLKNDRVVKSEYDALVKCYGDSDSVLIAKKGLFGLININNEPITEFAFQEIYSWNDSVMLCRQDNKWHLFDFKQRRFLPEETFDTFDYVREDNQEVIIKTFKRTGYGLLSNRRGRIVADEYTGIVNLGTKQTPLFFLEKTVSKSNLYITLYIDDNGDVLREQVLNQEDYEKIACKQ